MCLKTVNSKEKTKKLKDSIPPKGLKVYKVVAKRDNRYYPLYQHTAIPFVKGKNEAITATMIVMSVFTNRRYKAGYHFWLNKGNAKKHEALLMERKNYIFGDIEIIECVIKKSWITDTGENEINRKRITQKGNEIIMGNTVVANKAIFPEYKE